MLVQQEVIMKYSGFYKVVYDYLTKVRHFTPQESSLFLSQKPFKVVLRTNNFIVRRKIIKSHTYCIRLNNKTYVGKSGSSLVAL